MSKEGWELRDALDEHAAALWEHGKRISRLFQSSPTPPQDVREWGRERSVFLLFRRRNDTTSSCVHSTNVANLLCFVVVCLSRRCFFW